MRDWQPFLGLPLWFWLFVIPTLFALFCLFYPNKAKRLLHQIWPFMDRVYLAFGILSAIFMVVILLLIVGQMVARWTNTVFPGGTEFAGYAMACTSFFALAFALTQGSHIRVSIFLNMNGFFEILVRCICNACVGLDCYILCAICRQNKFFIRSFER
jgi:TRAP-type C4-dicarboxylate transport system permease small subunit